MTLSKITNWRVSRLPEDHRIFISGTVSGHTQFHDGDQITTSAVKDYELIEGEEDFVVITNSNSRYLLHSPQKDQPFIKNRIIRYLDLINTTVEDLMKTGLSKDLAAVVDDKFE